MFLYHRELFFQPRVRRPTHNLYTPAKNKEAPAKHGIKDRLYQGHTGSATMATTRTYDSHLDIDISFSRPSPTTSHRNHHQLRWRQQVGGRSTSTYQRDPDTTNNNNDLWIKPTPHPSDIDISDFVTSTPQPSSQIYRTYCIYILFWLLFVCLRIHIMNGLCKVVKNRGNRHTISNLTGFL